MPAVQVDVGGVVDGVFNGLDALFTSDDERENAKYKQFLAAQKPMLMQAMTTLQEAQHPNWFVSGWRPFLGWVAGSSLLYHWLLKDFAIIGITVLNDQTRAAEIIALLPNLDGDQITGLIATLLGLGAIRGYEKVKGKARS